jgi:hypothetical protein
LCNVVDGDDMSSYKPKEDPEAAPRDRSEEREAIKKQVEEYLKKGGRIEVVDKDEPLKKIEPNYNREFR